MHPKTIPGLGDVQDNNQELLHTSSAGAAGQSSVVDGSASQAESPTSETAPHFAPSSQ